MYTDRILTLSPYSHVEYVNVLSFYDFVLTLSLVFYGISELGNKYIISGKDTDSIM